MNIKLSIISVLILTVFCEKADNITEISEVDQTELIFEKRIVSYPMGSSLDPANDVLLWGKFKGDERDEARLKSREITREGIRISNKIFRNLDGYSNDDLPELVLKAKNIFNEYSESESIYFAKQVFAMKVQNGLFEDFIETPNYSAYNLRNLTANEKELLLYSTRLTLESGNSNADMALLNLTRLKNEMSKEELNNLATLAISNAKSWYGIELCDTCNYNKKVSEMSKLERVYNSIESLEGITND